MKIIEGFKMRTLGPDHIVIPEGSGLVNFNKMLALNPSAAYLWENVEGKDFTVQDLCTLLLEKYDVDPAVAAADAAAIAEKWREAGVICE